MVYTECLALQFDLCRQLQVLQLLTASSSIALPHIATPVAWMSESATSVIICQDVRWHQPLGASAKCPERA